MSSLISKKIFKFDDPDIISVSEFIKNRLYFITYKNKIPGQIKNIHYFTADDNYSDDENSEPISRVSLGTICQFIKTLNIKLSRNKYAEKIIVNYSTGSERKRSNAGILMGVYAITNLKMKPEEAAELLSQHTKSLGPLDHLKAVEKAITLGFVDFNNFNCEDFNSLDDVKLHWVVPNKFLMFSGPLEASNRRYLSPRRYLEYFRHTGVQTTIRLCHIKYDANPFVGIDFPHYDLNIAGSIPSDKVLEVFLELSEECKGVVVVHCRDVLGRAGCLVGAFLVKHYGLMAGEALAWVRMCTSECILEVQKNWLKNNEAALQKAGEEIKQKDERGSKLVQGICAVRSIEVQSCGSKVEQSDKKASGKAEDVTARLENMIRVIESVVSESDTREEQT